MEHMEDINLKQLAEMLLKHIGLIIVVTLLCGTISFVYTEAAIKPLYESKVTMYVVNDAGYNVQKTYTSDIQASQMLVSTYKVIIKSDTVLNEVSKKLEERGITGYTADGLRSGITADSVNSTEIFEVKVKTPDPEKSYVIANIIADVAPAIIKDFVEASSVKIIDYAVEGVRVSPNVQKNMMLGLLIGLVISCLFVVLRETFDTRIKSEDELEQWFGFPLLAVIPDISASQSKRAYGYYYYQKRDDKKQDAKKKEASKNG